MCGSNSDTIALLSINPKYVRAIESGKKKIEFRKIMFKNDVRIILVYETVPQKKIVGCIEVKTIDVATPKTIWSKYSTYGFLSQSEFDSYYKNKEFAVGIVINKYIPFKFPLGLKEYNLFPPQSYCYVSGDLFQKLINESGAEYNII